MAQMAGPTQPQGPQQASQTAPDFISDDDFTADEDKYNTPGQTAAAAGEGLLKGLITETGASALEKGLGVSEEGIRGRAEAHPYLEGGAQAASLAGSALLGLPSEGLLLEKAGAAAAGLAGLGHVGEAAEAVNAAKAALGAGDAAAHVVQGAKAAYNAIPLAARVGSAAVRGAAEMAIMQSDNEAAKMILNDPQAAGETALSNIGLSAALGAGGGALVAGAISPLWKATLGPKLESVLGKWEGHLNSSGAKLPEDMQLAADTLSVDVGNELRAANLSHENAEAYRTLKYAQNPAIKDVEQNLSKNVSQSVADSLPLPVEAFQNYDVAEAGRRGIDATVDAVKAEIQPSINTFNELTEPFKNSPASQGHLADLTDKITTMALSNEKQYLKEGVPQKEFIENVLAQIPGLKTADDVKGLMTYTNNAASKNWGALGRAASDVKKLILDAQQNVLSSAIGKEGGEELFNKYVAARQGYAQAAKLANELGDHLGIGDFAGPDSFLKKLAENKTPEQFLSRLSPANNAEILPWLQKNLPGVVDIIRENELKKIVAPAVRAAKGDHPINVTTLQNAIKGKMAGKESYMKWVLPEELIKKAEAAETLKSIIPGMSDSGTPGGIEKMIRHSAASSMGAIAAILGHNPVMGALVGHISQLLRRDAPDGVRLAMLRFLGSEAPVKAEGFKAGVSFINSTLKGESMLAKATSNIFKSGAEVIGTKSLPTQKQRDKIDKIVESSQGRTQGFQQSVENDHTGHYFPQQQAAMATTTANALQYLQGLKPKAYQAGPLDRPTEPSRIEQARYNRALDIAQSPAIVLQHVKDGTLQVSDIQDLHSMYPSLYQGMKQRITNEIMSKQANHEPIPYKTRMALSLFMGDPLDSTMQPQNIMAAQPSSQPSSQPQGQGKGSPKALGKSNKTYMTPLQAAQNHHSGRE